MVSARVTLVAVAGVVGLASCRLPADARFRCEADLTCVQPGFVCAADGLCHPPGDLGADGGARDAGLCGNVACFHFDEGDGGVAADATGLNAGTLQNRPRWTDGRIGSALLFDGEDTYVDIGNRPLLQLTRSMTLCAWIYSTGAPAGGDDAAIISSLVGGSGYQGYQLDTTIDLRPVRRIGFKLTDSSGNLMIRYGATGITENAWHHVAGVYDAAAATLTVYLDGAVDEGELSGSVAHTQGTSPVGVTIGSRSGAPGAFNFKGRIDEVMIFDRALSAQEIVAIFRAAP